MGLLQRKDAGLPYAEDHMGVMCCMASPSGRQWHGRLAVLKGACTQQEG